MNEWKAVKVGPTWGVESDGELMVVGMSELNARQMVRECREAQIAEARDGMCVEDDEDAGYTLSGPIGGRREYYGDCP